MLPGDSPSFILFFSVEMLFISSSFFFSFCDISLNHCINAP